MSVPRIATGVSKSAITVLVHMPVAVMLAIALVEMESLVMVQKNSILIAMQHRSIFIFTLICDRY